MTFLLRIDGEDHQAEICKPAPDLRIAIGEATFALADLGDDRHGSGKGCLNLDGTQVDYRLARDGNQVHIRLNGRTWVVQLVDPRDAAQSAGGGSDDIRAPMPGAIVSHNKAPGDTVSAGETVLTIESMKLQTNLPAPRDGIIGEVLKAVGDTFDKDETVARLEPMTEEGDKE